MKDKVEFETNKMIYGLNKSLLKIKEQRCRECKHYGGITAGEGKQHVNCKKGAAIFTHFSGIRWFLTLNLERC